MNRKCKREVAGIGLAAILVCVAAGARAEVFVSTDAYKWVDDSIVQGEYKAWAVSPTQIESTYHAQPHFFMPIEKSWKLKNDIAGYPQLITRNKLHMAIYNMGLDEMVNAVEPDTTLRTGKEWAGVWTRDVSYSIILSMAYLQPEAAMNSLRKKVNANGRIIQDTGSGGAWPVSTDRMIWALAAYEVYKVTGSKDWLRFIYPIIRNTFEDDFKVAYSADGLVHGETSFIDWREQSYPKWMQTADIYTSEAFSTSAVHAAALDILSEIAGELGYKKEAEKYAAMSEKLAKSIDDRFWLSGPEYYGMYTYGRINPIVNPRVETLGSSIAILYDVIPSERAGLVTEHNPTTPFGPGIFFPQIKDMPAYHNNSLWPFVASYWTLANAKVGNEEGVLQGIGSVFRPAALFATNKENFNLSNGDIATELNSSNMLWCLSGNIALTHRVLFGIHFEKDGLRFSPVVPEALGQTRTLAGFKYRNAILHITVEGYGNKIKECLMDGKPMKEPFVKANIKGTHNIRIVMADNKFNGLKVNNTANKFAPLTPITWMSHDPSLAAEGVPVMNLLQWQPIEYIDHYIVLKDGHEIATTKTTAWAASEPGEWQVIGVDSDGTQGFASMPLNNYPAIVVEMPGEGLVAASPEISYAPKEAIKGWHGDGFVETDHKNGTVAMDVEVPADGTYSLVWTYANGNGPVNTENKCAIRTVVVDGVKAGNIVMPHRGVSNWSCWGDTNPVRVEMKAGKHHIELQFRPENENMNLATNHALIDRLTLFRLSND